jgi:hypothetical protein
MQMVMQCGLHLISKLRYDAALSFVYDGEQKGKGPDKKYGQKINYRNIPNQYLVEESIKDGIGTRIYQAQMLHQEFAQILDVLSSPRPISRRVPLPMSICSPAIWNFPIKRSSTFIACDSSLVLSVVEVSSSTSEMLNSTGAWKLL